MGCYGWGRIQPALSEARLQLLAITATQAEHNSAFQQHAVFSLLVELETADAIQIHDRRSMNGAKQHRVQILLQFRDTPAQQVDPLPYMQSGVVIGSFDPIDLRQPDEGYL
jgi:hypothetical protein